MSFPDCQTTLCSSIANSLRIYSRCCIPRLFRLRDAYFKHRLPPADTSQPFITLKMAKEFSIGFEAEVLLTPVQNTPAPCDLEDFVNWLVARYNENKVPTDLRLYSDISGMEGGDPNEAWTITDDITIETTFDKQCTAPFLFTATITNHLVSRARRDRESYTVTPSWKRLESGCRLVFQSHPKLLPHRDPP